MDGAAVALAGCGFGVLAYGLFSTTLRDRGDLDNIMRADRRYHRAFAPYFLGVGLLLIATAAVLFIVNR